MATIRRNHLASEKRWVGQHARQEADLIEIPYSFHLLTSAAMLFSSAFGFHRTSQLGINRSCSTPSMLRP
jgi:hypothetical protein